MVAKSKHVYTCVAPTNKYDVVIIFSLLKSKPLLYRDGILKPTNGILPSSSQQMLLNQESIIALGRTCILLLWKLCPW